MGKLNSYFTCLKGDIQRKFGCISSLKRRELEKRGLKRTALKGNGGGVCPGTAFDIGGRSDLSRLSGVSAAVEEAAVRRRSNHQRTQQRNHPRRQPRRQVPSDPRPHHFQSSAQRFSH